MNLTGGTVLPLALALWFLGLTDMRWRAAELSRLGAYWSGLVRSTPGEASCSEEGAGQARLGGAGERGREEGCEDH